MPEEKQPQTTPNTTPENQSSGIDLSKFGMSFEPVQQATAPSGEASHIEEWGWSVLEQLNRMQTETKADIEFEKIQIEWTDVANETKIKFGRSGAFRPAARALDKQEARFYERILSWSGFVFLLSIVAVILFQLYGKYLDVSLSQAPDTQYQGYVQQYKEFQKTVSQYTNIDNYYNASVQYANFARGAQDVNDLVRAIDLSYLQKKDILQNALQGLSNEIIGNNSRLTSIKQEISKYWYVPQDVFALVDNQNGISMKSLLLSIENIKFTSAIKVFGYLDTFIQSLATTLSMSPEDVKTKMQALNTLGEKDVLVYLNDCYLNPFEIDYDCGTIGDFDRYYKLIRKDTTLDRTFLKKVLYYIDLKLEQTDLPSFLVTFSRFNPRDPKISFTIEINTFKQDEIALAKQGILSPHLFILSNLLNLFRQSLVVVTEDVKTNSIDVSPRTIKIWSTVFTVNSSSMTFTLPIQKSAQREISDFVQINQ